MLPRQMFDPASSTLLEARRALTARELSSVELTQAVLSRIERLNPQLNAYLQLDGDEALAQARAAEKLDASRPLHGLPICIKAVIDVAGVPTTAGAAGWTRQPTCDAPSVARLRAAGAVILATANTNEFCYGIDGRNPHWGNACNPVDPARLSGGSSSGPAVATGAGMALAGLGTDTSGSIRIPASFCGLVGLRPTPGRIPVEGIVPLAPSYDVPGFVTRDVDDHRYLFNAVASPGRPRAGDEPLKLRGMRVGVLEQLMDAAEPYVGDGVTAAARRLEDAGATLEPVRIDGLEDAPEIHRVIQQAEAAQVHEPWFESQRERYEAGVRQRLEAGRAVLAMAYLDAVEARAKLRRRATELMNDVPILIAPTSPCVPTPQAHTEITVRGVTRADRDVLLSCVVAPAQFAAPVASVPIGTQDGLPFGMQIIAAPGEDELALAVAGTVFSAGR
jgi:aspartyl-tRNA(Asn)/glutamyl-tRNA(Gln) amidotransferase subunit A